MNFAFSEEQEQLREFVRQFLDNYSAEATVRELMETEEGYDSDTWAMMAEQLGLQSLIIPEEHGGQGFGYVELVVVMCPLLLNGCISGKHFDSQRRRGCIRRNTSRNRKRRNNRHTGVHRRKWTLGRRRHNHGSIRRW